MLSNFDVRVLTGSDYVEVRPKQVHKGQMIAKAILAGQAPEGSTIRVDVDGERLLVSNPSG